MTQIFISYRRADSHAITDRIQDRLTAVYGAENVFQDVEDIPPGANFKEYLEIQVGLCDVLLVIIGPRWLDIRDENGSRRLDNPSDFVRIEVESGLKRKEILVVPVLVQGAAMPLQKDLPPSIQELHYRNAIRVRNNPDFERDIQNLIDSINQYVTGTAPKKPEPARSKRSPLMMIVGLVLLVALLAAGALVGLPLLTSDPTPTPDVTATAAAVAALDTATAAALPTITPTPTPTESPSPSPSPESSPTAAPTATVRYPDGLRLVLDYNDTGLYLRNASSRGISTSMLRFRAFNTDEVAQRYQFFGSTWAGYGVPTLNANRCVRIELLGRTSFTRPDECSTYAAAHQEPRANDGVFWVPRSGVEEFRVYWNNEEIGRCQVAAGHCEIFLPPA